MSLIELDLQTQHHFSDGLYAKQMVLPKDHFAITHAHKYDHLSILASGKVVVDVNGLRTEYVAPACINILADQNHSIIALEDSVWFCVHATDETDADSVDEVLIRS